MGDKILIDKKDGIAVVTMNNPKVLNALSTEFLKEIDETFTKLETDDEVKVVVITGVGKAFVAGADISEMQNMTASEGEEFGGVGARVFRKIECFVKPIIAAVNGYALGGGNELALACDIRIASDKAKFGFPETGLGIIPGFSGTQRMPRLIGKGLAAELIFSANIIDADEAYRIGLVNKTVSSEELMPYALNLAGKIASNGQIGVRNAKKAINEGVDLPMDEAIALENKYFGMCFGTEEQKIRMEKFLNKNK